MTESEPRSPRSSDTVRVYLPSHAAHDLDAVGKISRQVLEKLGCPGCTSGFEIRFIELRDAVSSAGLMISESSPESRYSGSCIISSCWRPPLLPRLPSRFPSRIPPPPWRGPLGRLRP